MTWSWRTELPQLLILLGMFLAAAIAWPDAPDRMPIHWNAAGEVDGYGGRFEGLLLMPLIALGMYGLFWVIPRFDPGRANYERFAGAYTVIRVALLVLFAVIYAIMQLSMRGHDVDVALLVPLMAGALFVVLGGMLGKIRPNWFVGVRTPWTLSSKLSWTRTHRLAGWLFVITGLLTLATGLFRPTWGVPVILVGGIGTAVVVVVYSYLVWKDAPDKQPPAGTEPAD